MSYAPDTLHRPAEWAAKGTCAQPPYVGSDLWYADEWQKDDRRTAISLCRTCPVLDACRTAAASEEAGKGKDSRHGIRAALTPGQRWSADQKARAKPKAKRGGRRLAPCGTRGAYDRHLRLGEPVDDACRLANNTDRQKRRVANTSSATASQNGQR
ncbi:WhiB family transcriptional regulator [Streptomyces sp. NBC_01591]|uniref:WhiB family transcriptional regulator n=1 Tax=Streptomyces sp. NBC_01591 TaxID=2975888 RepID=UPI002DD90E25|nr:WhiB family transcriptional regulator [Streptomyces sp. NBC_01591]WSD71678.1 WhiB family transcriptional regulator [Streptomyces sp. NBC_01591]